MAAEAAAAGERLWGLGDLADRQTFDRYLDAVATALADRFAVRVHVNVAARRRAFNDWIATLQEGAPERAGHERFIKACADLIACLGSRRIVSFSAMMREDSDPMSDVVLRFPNEVTALATGAAFYITRVAALTGADPSEPIPPAVAENAAALLRRHPQETAERFRELLRLTTPWV
jgi:hypothetical protein